MQLNDFTQQLFNVLKDPETLKQLKLILSGQVWVTQDAQQVLRHNNRVLKYKKIDPRAKAPVQAKGSAGYDLFPLEACYIEPGESVKLDIGLAMEFEDDLAALLVDRSGLGLKGVIRRAGLIDAPYRGNWIIVLYNSSKEPIAIHPDKACIQVLFLEKIRFAHVVETTELSDTVRGTGGFGSTDTKGAAA